jgi:hypothetical protein
VKKEAKIILEKATDSVLLSVEHFNRPWDRGRTDAVLILLDRSFELLLKAVIIEKGGKIREPRANETIGFDACVRKCISDSEVKCLTKEEAITIQILNSLRDAAQHYILDLSEQQLYLYCQSALTLFDKILNDVFQRKLIEFMPERVLPVSSDPPKDFNKLMDVEFEDIKRLEVPRKRKSIVARAKLRSLAIIDASLGGSRLQPGENELKRIEKKIKQGENWTQIFANIKRLTLSTADDGINVSLRITKKEGSPVHLVPEGTPGATIIAVKRVDELGYYSLNLTDLSEKIKVTSPKLNAVIHALKVQDNPEYYKEIKIGKCTFKRYSSKALDFLINTIPTVDIDKVWSEFWRKRRKADST